MWKVSVGLLLANAKLRKGFTIFQEGEAICN